MRAASSLLLFALSGCLFFDEPGLRDDADEDDLSERVDCFADLPDEAAGDLLHGVCEEFIDRGADGVTDLRASYRYDAAGRRVSVRVDATLVTYAYDEAGNLELTEIDRLIDGEIDSRERRDYACFEGEEPDALPGACSIATDTNGDGLDDILQSFGYEKGVLVRAQTEIAGRVVSVATHEHDEAGRLDATSIDTTGDGRIDTLMRYGYDDDGGLLYQRIDNMVDGSIDHALEYTLDGSGRVSVMEEYALDALRATTRYDRDDEGRVTLETTSYPGTRGIGIERRYDLAGNLLAEAYFDEPRRNYECRRYEYDCF